MTEPQQPTRDRLAAFFRAPHTAPVLLVAELSANHGGSLARAVATVEAFADAGADAIKLQTYTADALTIDCDRSEFRIDDGPWRGRTLHELYREAQTPWEWHEPLRAAAQRCGVPLFSTPFDERAVTFLQQQGVAAYKIASFELVDHELLAAVAATGRPIVLSTGMATEAEIAAAVATIRGGWGERDLGLVLLHCVSAYPAPARDMRLHRLQQLATRFGVPVGLSDHTLGTTVATAAVALGARLIEKHVTLARADGGPDAHFSLEPAEFAALAAAVREVEAAITTAPGEDDGPTPSERASLLFRRSLFAVGDI
ncbi:MAG: pseudaminic acid synthase, partial [Planctomycetes bacterium]|nr:pseudaminic acid synthase [Planctomycetota bacterium]